MRPYTEMIDYLKNFDFPMVTDTKKITRLNIECGFDIETTSIKKQGVKNAFMYVWQIGIGYGNDVFYGRTWSEFVDLINDISDLYELDENKRLVIYVHNLGYEFQFMRHYFHWLDVFAISKRKPIRALTLNGIEFRDSLILSGYSLANTAKNLATHKIKKLTGDLDYSLIRHHNTPLTDDEISYCINDIQIILAYINEQITYCGDISEIPMTNTGRVRKYVKDRCFFNNKKGGKRDTGQHQKYRKIMQDLTIDVDTYVQLKRAFMGGFTHANSNHSGKLLQNVTSIDFTSSYPSVMLAEKFPMSRFRKVTIESLDELESLCQKHAVVFEAKFDMISPRITQENYISESKCRNIANAKINNGRISSADSITVTITEIDYHIMKQAYQWENLAISNIKYAHKAYLPKQICTSILELYQDKTKLKDVTGYEVEYLLSKGMLNSIYGMCVTDVVKYQSTYDNVKWETERPNVNIEVDKYNKSKNRFLYYPWGIWVTAYARRNLWTGIIAAGDDYVYSDTDSLKVLNYEKHVPYTKWFDSNIIKKMEKMCNFYSLDKSLLSPKTKKGVTKMLGVWDYEGTYSNFKTLGAKRYLYQHGDKLAITVAGLSKQNGLSYMLENANNDPLKVFDLFDDNLYIPSDKTGKMTHSYIDDDRDFKVKDYLGKTEHINCLSSLHLEPCDFTLSISDKYKDFLSQLSSGLIFKGARNV